VARVTRVSVTGMEELRRKLTPKMVGEPLRTCFQKATKVLLHRARGGAPVDSGALRASLGREIDGGAVPKWAKVGTDLYYGPFVEHGTGTFGKGTPHWPPGQAMDSWAKARGFDSGWHASQAIGKRGGVRAQPFLRPALKDSVTDIRRFVEQMGAEIRQRFGG
jgi:hypothetical protein